MSRVKKKKDSLLTIPGVGKSIAEDLRSIGIDRPSCLKHKKPEALYRKLCKKQNAKIDRCMLYVFRCAIYFVSNKHHNPEKLKWWNWSDANIEMVR